MQEWPPVIRVSHLLGGCKAISEPGGKMTISPSTPNKGKAKCSLPNYESFLSVLTQEGLTPIGIEYYESQDTLDGHYPPKWVSINQFNNKNNDSNIHTWRNIVNSADENKDFKCVDITARVSFQLKALETRLRDISDSYSRELDAIVDVGNFDTGCSIESRNTFQIGLSIHSFLADACTLRDYLAEYLNLCKYKTGLIITSHAGLYKNILKKTDSSDPLTKWLLTASSTKSSGWLAKLGAYRDLAIHSVPLTYAGRKSQVFQRYRTFGGGELPNIFYPLPDDPIKIASERSKRNHNNFYEEYWSRVYSIESDTDKLFSLQDALEYCWKVNSYLSIYAAECAKLAPYRPKMPEYNESNILEIKFK